MLIGFSIALAALLLFPSLKLFFFAPLLIATCYKRPLPQTLLWAAGCGMLMDLLSGYNHLGLHAANYTLSILILYPQKKHFFEDQATTLPFMTFFFSVTSTLIQVVLLRFFETPIPITPAWIMTDLIIYPAVDALYAYLLFTLPGWVMPKKTHREYFMDS